MTDSPYSLVSLPIPVHVLHGEQRNGLERGLKLRKTRKRREDHAIAGPEPAVERDVDLESLAVGVEMLEFFRNS